MSKGVLATVSHIRRVQENLHQCTNSLIVRAVKHDASKLESPELEIFEEHTHKLAGLTYNSPEYKAQLAAIQPALEHHYANNRHHPEHYPDGIRGMSLLDIIEMLADWKAASERQNNGNLIKSIQSNQDRFGFSDELKAILINTAKELNWQ